MQREKMIGLILNEFDEFTDIHLLSVMMCLDSASRDAASASTSSNSGERSELGKILDSTEFLDLQKKYYYFLTGKQFNLDRQYQFVIKHLDSFDNLAEQTWGIKGIDINSVLYKKAIFFLIFKRATAPMIRSLPEIIEYFGREIIGTECTMKERMLLKLFRWFYDVRRLDSISGKCKVRYKRSSDYQQMRDRAAREIRPLVILTLQTLASIKEIHFLYDFLVRKDKTLIQKICQKQTVIGSGLNAL